MAGNSATVYIAIQLLDAVSPGLQNVGKEAKQTSSAMTTSFKAAGKTLGEVNAMVGKTISLVGKAASAVDAWGVAKGFLDTAAQFESMAISLETVTGSAAAAKQAMAWITQFTAKTPFELAEVTDAFSKLSSQGLDPQKYLGTLGDTASAMGKTLDQTVEMFADASTGQFERLKEFGVQAKTEGDQVTFSWMQNGQQMETTTAKTGAAISESLGKVFAHFEGGMEAQSQTWNGMVSNLSDTWTQFELEVMESGPFLVLKEQLSEFLDYLGTNEGQMDLRQWAADTADGVLVAFEVMSYAAQAFFMAFDGWSYIINGIKMAFSELGLMVLDLYESIPTWLLPESMELSQRELLGMRQSLLEIQSDAWGNVAQTMERGERTNDMFSGLRDRIGEIRNASNQAVPAVDALADALEGAGEAAGNTASPAGNANEDIEKQIQGIVWQNKQMAATYEERALKATGATEQEYKIQAAYYANLAKLAETYAGNDDQWNAIVHAQHAKLEKDISDLHAKGVKERVQQGEYEAEQDRKRLEARGGYDLDPDQLNDGAQKALDQLQSYKDIAMQASETRLQTELRHLDEWLAAQPEYLQGSLTLRNAYEAKKQDIITQYMGLEQQNYDAQREGVQKDYELLLEDAKKNGGDRVAVEQWKSDKIKEINELEAQDKSELARKSYEEQRDGATSFIEYMRGQRDIDTEAWKTDHEKQLDDWKDYYGRLSSIASQWQSEMSSALGNALFDGIKGDMKAFGDYWSDFMDSMLRSFTSMVADMAAQWAMNKLASVGMGFFDALFPSSGSISSNHFGNINVGPDELLAKLQQGEIIIPAKQSAAIRSALGGDGMSKNEFFDRIVGSVEGGSIGVGTAPDLSDPAALGDHLGRGLARLGMGGLAYVANLTQGMATVDEMAAQGLLPGDLLAKAKDFVGKQALMGALSATVPNIITGFMGDVLTDAFGVGEYKLLSDIASAAITLFGLGPAGLMLGPLLSPFIGLAISSITDWLDIRKNETLRDSLEDHYGHLGGRRAWSFIKDKLKQADTQYNTGPDGLSGLFGVQDTSFNIEDINPFLMKDKTVQAWNIGGARVSINVGNGVTYDDQDRIYTEKGVVTPSLWGKRVQDLADFVRTGRSSNPDFQKLQDEYENGTVLELALGHESMATKLQGLGINSLDDFYSMVPGPWNNWGNGRPERLAKGQTWDSLFGDDDFTGPADNASWGRASGGVVDRVLQIPGLPAPPGDDGWVGIQLGEVVLSRAQAQQMRAAGLLPGYADGSSDLNLTSSDAQGAQDIIEAIQKATSRIVEAIERLNLGNSLDAGGDTSVSGSMYRPYGKGGKSAYDTSGVGSGSTGSDDDSDTVQDIQDSADELAKEWERVGKELGALIQDYGLQVADVIDPDVLAKGISDSFDKLSPEMQKAIKDGLGAQAWVDAFGEAFTIEPEIVQTANDLNDKFDDHVERLKELGASELEIAGIEAMRAGIIAAAQQQMRDAFMQEIELRQLALHGTEAELETRRLAIAQQDELKDATRQFGADSAEVAALLALQADEMADLQARMAKESAAFMGSLDERILRANGDEAGADRLAFETGQADELAEAVAKYGEGSAEVIKLQQALTAEMAAYEEAIAASRTELEKSIEVQYHAAIGNQEGVEWLQLMQDHQERWNAAVEAGVSGDSLQMLEGTLAREQELHALKWNFAKEEEATTLQIRELRAKGQDEQAEAMERELAREKELHELRMSGASEEEIAKRAQLQALEEEKRAAEETAAAAEAAADAAKAAADAFNQFWDGMVDGLSKTNEILAMYMAEAGKNLNSDMAWFKIGGWNYDNVVAFFKNATDGAVKFLDELDGRLGGLVRDLVGQMAALGQGAEALDLLDATGVDLKVFGKDLRTLSEELGLSSADIGSVIDLVVQQQSRMDDLSAIDIGDFDTIREKVESLRGLGPNAKMLTDQWQALFDGSEASWQAYLDALQQMQDAEMQQLLDQLVRKQEIADEDLEVRELEAAGEAKAAKLMKLRLSQERELEQAIAEGASDEYLAKLKDIQVTEMLTAVEEDHAKQVEELAASYKSAGESLQSTIDNLRMGDLDPGDAASQLDRARTSYEELRDKALAGDVDAMQELGSAAQDYLSRYREFYGSSTAYAGEYERVLSVLEEAKTLADSYAEDPLTSQLYEEYSQATIDELQKIGSHLGVIGGLDAVRDWRKLMERIGRPGPEIVAHIQGQSMGLDLYQTLALEEFAALAAPPAYADPEALSAAMTRSSDLLSTAVDRQADSMDSYRSEQRSRDDALLVEIRGMRSELSALRSENRDLREQLAANR